MKAKLLTGLCCLLTGIIFTAFSSNLTELTPMVNGAVSGLLAGFVGSYVYPKLKK
jgi:hypothetical protein